MELPSTLRRNKGFTLLEVVIVMGILAIIFSMGIAVSFDFYRNYSFRSEKDTIISLLQKARSQSMNNINQVRHGVRFQNPLQYIVFECEPHEPPCIDYAHANTSRNMAISPSYGTTISNTPFDVVFDQLSGCLRSTTTACSADPVTITVSDGPKSYAITINSEGQIDW